jgi:hypothetical protein
MIGKFGTAITTSTGGGGTYSTVLREYTTSGTWTKPSGLLFIEIVCIGGGGGGACGGRQASGVVGRGGGGAGSGGITYRIIPASDLGSTESYTIGAGGNGTAGRTTDNTAGANGNSGGSTTFGSLANANGGSAAIPTGRPTAIRSGTRFDDVNRWIENSSSGSRSDGGIGDTPPSESAVNGQWYVGHGGGAGGGVTTANVASNGGAGNRYFNSSGTLNTAASAGVASGGAGGNGVDNYVNRFYSKLMLNAGATKFWGTSGAGGAGHAAGTAGAGGNGGLYGAAGGGGGGSRNGFNSGAGGNGAGGLIVIVEHIVS